MATRMRVVLPGDRIDEIDLSKTSKVILGPGLRQNDDKIFACKAGVLFRNEKKAFWVDNHQKRYIPTRGEKVIGVVVQKMGDYFKVDIGSSESAIISYLAFENATKKNRPNIKPGDLLYAKLLDANREMEPELVCVDSNGKAGDLGVLEGGFVFSTTLHHIRILLAPDYPLLKAMSKELSFEVSIGFNGKVWVNGKTAREMIAVGNILLAAQYVTDDELTAMCKNVTSLLAKYL